MQMALDSAKTAGDAGVVPIGAVIVNENEQILAVAHNGAKCTEHAEMLAIDSALDQIGSDKLRDCSLYTTLEPCIMCAGAILNAQIERVYFGAWDEKFGAAGSVWDLLRDPLAPHHPQVYGGVLETECSELLKEWFINIRKTLT